MGGEEGGIRVSWKPLETSLEKLTGRKKDISTLGRYEGGSVSEKSAEGGMDNRRMAHCVVVAKSLERGRPFWKSLIVRVGKGGTG